MNQKDAIVLKKARNRATRAFIISAIALFLPGLLGWLNDLLKWANSRGIEPFPDVNALGYLAASALVGALIATITFLLKVLEGTIFASSDEEDPQ